MPYSSTVLSDSPLAYFRLGELSGSTGADLSGNGNTITYTNGPLLGQPGALLGEDNRSVYFDGSNDYVISTITAGDFDVNAAHSWELWVKPDAVDLSFANRDMVLYLGNAGAYSPNFAFDGIQIQSGNIEYVRNTGSGGVAAVGAISAGAWSHVVATYDTSNLRMYVNGVLRATTAVGATGTVSLNAAAALNLGRYPNSLFYTGFLDEVAVYTSVLTAERVAAHFAAAQLHPSFATLRRSRRQGRG